jgi:hypothetical protein
MRTSAIIPADLMDAINARLEFDAEGNPTGFGPGNFSVPLHQGADATHAGLSCGNVEGFLDLLLELEASGDFPGLVVDYEGKPQGQDEPPSRADFGQMVAAQALEPFDGFPENLPQKDDQRSFGGKTWISLIDNNVWTPPVGWRDAVSEGYPAWVQPVGAVDAYALGARVSFNGADYESLIPANVWSPSAYPAGWMAL